MTVPVVAFFNNKGGVGKTSLVYHLAWMYSDLGASVLAADLDPQANLTTAFLSEERLEELWLATVGDATVYGSILPLVRGVGDIVASPHVEEIAPGLGLMVGDLALSGFEDDLSQQWPRCLDRDERAFRVLSAFWRLLQRSAEAMEAQFVLVDLGPNLGAINRAALVSADFLIVPLAPDLFSLQGLRNLGPTVRRWREEWADRLGRAPKSSPELPRGTMYPVGYIVMQHAVRLDRPVRAYEQWAVRIPTVYAEAVLNDNSLPSDAVQSRYRLGMIKHYRSLMPMAQEARKPMFHLASADGAIGSHAGAVQDAYSTFRDLAGVVAERCGLVVPAFGRYGGA